MVTSAQRREAVKDWCCGMCFDVTDLVARLGTGPRALDDVTDFVRLDLVTIASILRRHGHGALADRLNPAGRRTTPVQDQQQLPGLVA